MEELNNYLKWCDTQYCNNNHCNCGVVCTNNNYCGGNQTDCYLCIKRVHNLRNRTVHYNCDKMLLCYVLKHCYRFGAEIYYEFSKLYNDLCNWNDIFILSIGCGPCTELFGALSFWRSMGKRDGVFHYRGFDKEGLWMPLMNNACSSFTTADVKSFNEDVFSHYKNSQERVDVIVLNYMLSDMFKFHFNQYDLFLESLCEFIKQKQPKYLLINDIYLLDSIGASNKMLKYLQDKQIVFKHVKLQYHSINPYIGQFGKKIVHQPFTMADAEIVRKYEPFSEVNSIQTFIRFQ